MPDCLVLGDSAVHELLLNLSTEEVVEIRNGLAKSLVDFSVGDERKYQPDASVATRPNGVKTLFRPFTSSTAVGMKIVVDPSTAPTPAPSSDQQKGAKTGEKPTIHGIMALCDEHGFPNGFINADEITGHRTSLNVMVPYSWRRNTANIVVFGAGKQAMWHIRLAFALKGDDIKRVTVVNRNVDRASKLIDQIKAENQSIWKSPANLESINPEDSEGILKTVVSEADVIFCTTPSKKPLFPAEYLHERLRSGRGCFISGIGSWQPDMVEINPVLLNDVVRSDTGYNPRGGSGGAILTDDRGTALKDSGELSQSEVAAEQVVEVGEAIDWKEKWDSERQGPLNQWLEEGFVIYKSIGVSLTDLAAGSIVLSLARKHGKGTIVKDF